MRINKALLGAGVLGLIAITALIAFLLLRDDGKTPTKADLALYEANGITVGVAMVPGTPEVGANRLVVELQDEAGEPITNARFRAFAEMPAMGAMPAMRAPADLTETAPGHYEAIVNLSMRGEWPLTLAFETPDGRDARLQFDLATDRPGLQLAGGATRVEESQEPDHSTPPQAAEETEGPIVTIDSRRRQLIGVETAQAEVRDLVRSIRAVGQVTYDERLLSQITLRFEGFIGELFADYVGTEVEEGQILFTVYSPDLLAAQREYLEVYGRRASTAGSLLEAARQRLLLWDMAPETIEQLEKSGEAQPYVPIHAPRSGTVVELNIADGSAAPAGKPLMIIADLSRVWVEAQVYEADLSLLQAGMSSTIVLPYLPERRYQSKLEYIYPFLSEDSRTGRVRLTLNNDGGELKPAMYAEVALKVLLEDRLTVPEEAVLVAGASRVVFVDMGGGRLQARHIKTGRRAEGYVEVLEGLEPGVTVVTSGNFLIAAETRLKTGIEQW